MIKIINESNMQIDVPELRDENEKYIVIKISDNQDSIFNLIDYIRKQADTGHSFNVVVDPGDEREERFFIDGDGTDKILSIKTCEYEGDSKND